MKIVCMSDVHSMIAQVRNIPDGDLLIVSGDLTNMGSLREIGTFIEDIAAIRSHHNYQDVIIIAGNHDFGYEDQPEEAKKLIGNTFTYLQDSSIMFEGLKVYGSPWTPYFGGWAFNLDKFDAHNDYSHAKRIWGAIPDDTNILITHGPPQYLLDKCDNGNVGCPILRQRVNELKHLKLHVYGHIHQSAGVKDYKGKIFVNAATCDESYSTVNPPIVIEL